jgi:WD40 repeat protein
MFFQQNTQLQRFGSSQFDPYGNSARHYGAVSFSPDGSILIPGSNLGEFTTGRVLTWNGTTYVDYQALTGIATVCAALPVSNSHIYLGTGFDGNATMTRVLRNISGVWTLTQSTTPAVTVNGDSGTAIVLSPDESHIIVMARNGVVFRFTITGGGDTLASPTQLPGQTSEPESGGSRDDGAGGIGIGNLWGQRRLIYTNDGANLIACRTRRLLVWSRVGSTYTAVGSIPTVSMNNQCIDISPDGTLIVVGGLASPYLQIFSLSGSGPTLTLTALPTPLPAPTFAAPWVQFGVVI